MEQLQWNFDRVYPCVGCGYCCKKAPCPAGFMIYGRETPCGGLRFKDGRYWCGLVLDADTEKDRLLIKDRLYIGEGCTSSLNSDRQKILRCQRQNRSSSSSGTGSKGSGKSGTKGRSERR